MTIIRSAQSTKKSDSLQPQGLTQQKTAVKLSAIKYGVQSNLLKWIALLSDYEYPLRLSIHLSSTISKSAIPSTVYAVSMPIQRLVHPQLARSYTSSTHQVQA